MSSITAENGQSRFFLLAFGSLFWDRMTLLADDAAKQADPLVDFIARYRLAQGCKVTATPEQYQQLSSAFSETRRARYESPGGTAANILRNFTGLADHAVSAGVVGAVGADAPGQRILQAFEAAGIRFMGEQVAGLTTPISTIIVQGHDRRIIKSPDHEDYCPSLTNLPEADAVLMTGQLGSSCPEVVDKTIRQCLSAKVPVFYTLPTDADFAVDNRAEIRRFMQQAALILSNLDEVQAATGMVGAEAALPMLQEILSGARPVSGRLFAGRAVALVTDGAHGSYVVTSERIIHIPVVTGIKVLNTAGAGDATFGAFLAAAVNGFDPEGAAVFASHVAAHTVEVPETCLADPRGAIMQRFPELQAAYAFVA